MKKTILLLTAISLMSCGSRKVQRSKTEDKTHIEMSDISGQKTIDNSVISVIEIDSTSEMLIEPIDTTKEMVVNGKKYINSRIKWKKTNKVKKLVENKKIVKTERKAVKIVAKREKKLQTMKSDRESSYWWLLWFLLLIPIYLAYRFIKNYYLNVLI